MQSVHWLVFVDSTCYEALVTTKTPNGKTKKITVEVSSKSVGCKQFMGHTSKSASDIKKWTARFEEDYSYDLVTTNCQFFAIEFIKWLTDGRHRAFPPRDGLPLASAATIPLTAVGAPLAAGAIALIPGVNVVAGTVAAVGGLAASTGGTVVAGGGVAAAAVAALRTAPTISVTGGAAGYVDGQSFGELGELNIAGLKMGLPKTSATGLESGRGVGFTAELFNVATEGPVRASVRPNVDTHFGRDEHGQVFVSVLGFGVKVGDRGVDLNNPVVQGHCSTM